MHRGYIKYWRKSKDTAFYKNPKASHLATHLLLSANHKAADIYFNGQMIHLDRGQAITGREALSRDTGLSIQETRTALQCLARAGFLTIRPTKRYSIITICNYEIYQSDDAYAIHQANHLKRKNQPSINHQLTTNNNVNNENNEKNNLFDLVWNKYPNKDGRKTAERSFAASVKTEQDFKDINLALENYLKSPLVIKGFIKNGSTWFNNWKDWVNPSPAMCGSNWERQDGERNKRFQQFLSVVEARYGTCPENCVRHSLV